MYFILSGYIHKEDRPLIVNLKKRASTLLMPYIEYNFLLLLATITIDTFKNNFDSLKYWKILAGAIYSRFSFLPLSTTQTEANTFLLTNYNASLWFLTALTTSSIVFFLITKYINSKTKFLLAGAILLTLTFTGTKLPILLPWSIDVAGIGAFFMLTGVMLKKYGYFSIAITPKHLAVLIALSLIYPILCYINRNINMSIRNYGDHGAASIFLFFAIGTIGSVVFIQISKLISKLPIGDILSSVGQHTISILALHVGLLTAIDSIFSMQEQQKNISYWIFSAIKIIATLIIAYNFSKMIDKYKARAKNKSQPNQTVKP